jgi:hypothetical protein
MGLRENEELFVKSLPTLSDMAAKEINFNPHSMMIQELRKALATWKNDSRAGRLILAGFEHAAAGQQKMDQRQLKSNNGNVNFTETVMIVMKESPASAADLAELITTNEGLKELETKDILRILKSENEPTVGLYPSLEGLPPARKSKLTDILFNVFRPELVKRLAAAAGKVDSDLLNAIVDLTRLKTQAAVWQPVGVSSSEGRIWRYCSLNPLTEADKLPPEVGPPRRLRKIALPAGMDRWYSPDFDDSKWKSGRAPIGVGIFKPDGHSHLNPNFAFKNNSDWGDGEFLLARSTFDVRDLDFDYYRIGILANEGYIIYLNGHEIKNYFWFSGSPSYGQFILGKDQMGYLRKGANTLAVYCNLKYEKDRKLEQQYHPIGQMDLVFEGLKKKDLGLAR